MREINKTELANDYFEQVKAIHDIGYEDLQLTNRTKFDWLANTDDEYRLGLEYEITKKVSLVANVDSDYDGGVGIKVKL